LPNSLADGTPRLPLAFPRLSSAADDEVAPTANCLLQNCDGRDKSELRNQACYEYEQRRSMV